MHTIIAAHGPEFDLGQVVFIIMLLVGGFFQWLMNLLKQKRAATERTQQLPATSEELEARNRAWQRQTAAGDQASSAPVARNQFEDLLETFRAVSVPKVVMPPLVSPVIPQAVVSAEASPPAKLLSASPAIVQQKPCHPLAVKLSLIGGLREAVVLREILGPPKALQTADDHLN